MYALISNHGITPSKHNKRKIELQIYSIIRVSAKDTKDKVKMQEK